MSNDPFKTVTVEYFEDFYTEVKKIGPDCNLSQPFSFSDVRRIKVITTTRDYNLGYSKGNPIVSVTYAYL